MAKLKHNAPNLSYIEPTVLRGSFDNNNNNNIALFREVLKYLQINTPVSLFLPFNAICKFNLMYFN